VSARIDVGFSSAVYLEESHKLPLVSIVLALRTGNAHDPPGKDGLARITARMTRRGCVGLETRAIEDAIDRLGAEMSVDTSASSVAIHAQVIARNVDPFVELLARLIGTPTFPQDELERLRRETLAEIEEGKDHDRALAQRAFRRAMFGEHAYARDGAGRPSTVKAITMDYVGGDYARRFTRANAVLGFAGDVTPEHATRLAQRLLGGLPDGPPPVDGVGPPSMRKGRRLVLVDKPERTQTQIVIGTMGTWPHDADHQALNLSTAIFGGTFTSRLMQEVRSKRGWSYGASARTAIERQRHAFTMWTFPAAEDAAPCLELELGLLETWVRDGVTQEETDFIKGYLTRSHAFDIDTAPKRLHHAVDVEILNLPPDYHTGYLESVRAVTRDAAVEATRARISTEDLVIVVLGTADEVLEPVRAVIPDLAEHVVVPFDEDD